MARIKLGFGCFSTPSGIEDVNCNLGVYFSSWHDMVNGDCILSLSASLSLSWVSEFSGLSQLSNVVNGGKKGLSFFLSEWVLSIYPKGAFLFYFLH